MRTYNLRVNSLDLRAYLELFPAALEERYEDTFSTGFKAIDQRYAEVRAGRPLTVDDVIAIFERSLPFVRDWTKPDRAELERKMAGDTASDLIRNLNARYDLALMKKILDCFRELSLTSLVLHHVYPQKFSMCSHHIASLLYITGRRKAGTVPEFYLEYCRELEKWGAQFDMSVVETEFALWTWYRLANYGDSKDEHRRRFDRDPWVKKRRAARITDSLKVVDTIDFARFCLDTDHTLAAVMAWREFELRARELVNSHGRMQLVIEQLERSQGQNYSALWAKRNPVMHDDMPISEQEARDVVREVADFIERHKRKLRPR